MSKSRTPVRAGSVLAAAGLFTLLGAGVADAHVTAHTPEPLAKGGYGKIVFQVPNEEAGAATTKVRVNLPTDHPLASVSTEPVPGWTAATTKTTLATPITNDDGDKITQAVSSVTWTANPGTKLVLGEFQEFAVSVGPLPDDVDQLTLPAVQTYDNGDVINWNQHQAAGGAEPEHPAPTVLLTAKGADPMQASTGSGSAAPASATSGTDDTARWLGGAGLLVGALGLGVGGGAALRARRSGSSA